MASKSSIDVDGRDDATRARLAVACSRMKTTANASNSANERRECLSINIIHASGGLRINTLRKGRSERTTSVSRRVVSSRPSQRISGHPEDEVDVRHRHA